MNIQLAMRDIKLDGTTDGLPIIKRKLSKTEPPIVGEGIRLALYQGPILCGDRIAIQYNIQQLDKWAEKCKKELAQVLVVGELFVCGYNIRPADKENVVCTQDDILSMIQPIAIKHSIALVVPYAEKITVINDNNNNNDDDSCKMYDSIIVIDSNGTLLRNYRKTQLWGDDERSVWQYPYTDDPESAYELITLNGIRIGLLNCYEAEFPELCRILALKGAQVVLIPTAADVGTYITEKKIWSNWAYPDVSKTCITSNALANRVFCAYSNHSLYQFRSDGVTLSGIYLGNSTVADPTGTTMVLADNVETMLIVDCIPSEYPPVHPNGQSDYFKDRRPDLFAQLTSSTHIRNDTQQQYNYPKDPNHP